MTYNNILIFFAASQLITSSRAVPHLGKPETRWSRPRRAVFEESASKFAGSCKQGNKSEADFLVLLGGHTTPPFLLLSGSPALFCLLPEHLISLT